MLPSSQIQKLDGQTGTVPPSSAGVLAVIAPSSTGTQNQAATFSSDDLALAQWGNGLLVEYGSYDLAVAKKPFLGIRPITSTAAAYGAVTKTGTGSSVITAGAGAPIDDYTVLVRWKTGGTIGVAGITYDYSLDGGVEFSAVLALGTANALDLALPLPAGGGSSGCTFALGAGTIDTGDTFTCPTTGPRMNTSDLTSALTTLRNTRLAWEGVLIAGEASTATVALVDTWLAGLELKGQFKFALLNTRHKNLPSETDADFSAAMTTMVAGWSSIRMCVGTDAGDLTSDVTGLTLPRPVSLAIAARAMLIPLGEDPAFTGRGSIPGFSIGDGNGGLKWHDEDLEESLDDQRLTTFRTFPSAGPSGVYITNANVISSPGSDYKYLQHLRTMNRACEIAYAVTSSLLSIGVARQPPDPVTGNVYMTEASRQHIESLVQEALENSPDLKGQVSSLTFTLAGDDDISSNDGAQVHGSLKNAALAYIKKFLITSAFTKGAAA